MDTEVARDHLTDTEEALRNLVTDLADLVDWTADAAGPQVARSRQDATGKYWIALGVLGVLAGSIAVAAWRRQR
jgi:hypothetical protein